MVVKNIQAISNAIFGQYSVVNSLKPLSVGLIISIGMIIFRTLATASSLLKERYKGERMTEEKKYVQKSKPFVELKLF